MHAHARKTDPVTSSLAAASVTDLTVTKRRVLALLNDGPLTRDDLIARWRVGFPDDTTTDQSIRSRLSELMNDGRVEPHGTTTNSRGRSVQIVGLKKGPETLF